MGSKVKGSWKQEIRGIEGLKNDLFFNKNLFSFFFFLFSFSWLQDSKKQNKCYEFFPHFFVNFFFQYVFFFFLIYTFAITCALR